MLRLIFNIHFWEQYIRNQFIKQIDLLCESIQNRLIPTFDTIEKEAEQISDNEWDSLCSSSYSPDIDPANLADRAQEAGMDHYIMLSSIKQTLLNISAITLYHLFEQQIIFLLRRDVLRPSQENDPQLMGHERGQVYFFDIVHFPIKVKRRFKSTLLTQGKQKGT